MTQFFSSKIGIIYPLQPNNSTNFSSKPSSSISPQLIPKTKSNKKNNHQISFIHSMKRQVPPLSTVRADPPSSPRYPPPVSTPTANAQRRIAIAVDLSDESAFAVQWAVQNYLRPGDAVILLHIQLTSILYGADWGHAMNAEVNPSKETRQKLEDDFDNFTTAKANMLSEPLVEANIPFKIHIVKDHDLKERLCLEVERLGFSVMIMGSRGFGASKRKGKGRLGSVSDYCVRHCVCPVVVVRYSDDDVGDGDDSAKKLGVDEGTPVFHDAKDHVTKGT